jgi:hypothetical protein
VHVVSLAFSDGRKRGGEVKSFLKKEAFILTQPGVNGKKFGLFPEFMV